MALEDFARPAVELVQTPPGIPDLSVASAPTPGRGLALDERGRVPSVLWAQATLLNSWANVGSPWAPAGWSVDINGIVRLRGIVVNGSSAGAAFFTLPEGARPPYQLSIAFNYWTGAAMASGELTITTGGTVVGANTTGTGARYFDGIAFPLY